MRIRRNGSTEFVPAEQPIVLYDGDTLELDPVESFEGLMPMLQAAARGEASRAWKWDTRHWIDCPNPFTCPDAGEWVEVPGL